MRVLNVDDNPDNRYLLESMLRGFGCEVESARNGVEALQKLEQQDFDIIISDILMPEMDGFQFCREVQKRPKIRAIPFIFYTATYTERKDEEFGLSLGAARFILKPAEPEQFMASIHEVLSESERGQLVAPEGPVPDGEAYLAAYNQRLIHKLEDKVQQFEQTSRELQTVLEAKEREIAERHRIEETLREADRRKNEFLSMLSHELRNPLAPVRNSIELLRLAGPQDPNLQHRYDTIDRQVSHIARLLDDLLDVSRLADGRMELRLGQVRLADVVSQAVELIEPMMKARPDSLSVCIPREDIVLDADFVRLTQAIGNLLNNAAKYSAPQGRIWLTVSREGNEAVVRVRDNGTGIDPETLPHIFDLFVQADHTLARSQGGLGIGLTLARRIVELHRGSIEARSAGLGQGSEFIVRLPLNFPAAQQPPQAEAHSSRTVSGQRRILVVDDIEEHTTSLSMLLECWGYEVAAAYDGCQALKTAREFSPEIVLLDIGLPGIDGYEVARRLRAELGDKTPVLIAQTGYGLDSDKEKGREAGFDFHMVKPLDFKQLRELLILACSHELGKLGRSC